jgi:hypothetical protein
MRRVGILILILSTWFASAAWLQPHTQERTEIIIFDPPGTGTGPGQGSVAETINPSGAIVGFYGDPNNVFYGYLRATAPSPPSRLRARTRWSPLNMYSENRKTKLRPSRGLNSTSE